MFYSSTIKIREQRYQKQQYRNNGNIPENNNFIKNKFTNIGFKKIQMHAPKTRFIILDNRGYI